MNKSPDTKLLYVTTGVLKHMLINDQNQANSYTHIIMDEVHERELDVDFILAYLKKIIMTSQPKFKLILMSATINETKFQNYFASRVDDIILPAPTLNIGNPSMDTNNEVKEISLNNLTGNDMAKLSDFSIFEPKLSDSAVQECVSMLKNNLEMLDKTYKLESPGAVLIFLPGVKEIELLEAELRAKISPNDGATLEYIILHSRVPWEDHGKIFEDYGPNKRKVILSTNVAESSITLKDIVYVFDFCLTKTVVVDPDTGYESLKLCWASRQQLKQRKGRVGRVAKGMVFQLVPEVLMNGFKEEQPPEMSRVPLTKLVLEIKLCNFGTPKELLAISMEPPKLEDIDTAVLNLKMMGALLTTFHGEDSDDNGDLTVLGEIVAKLPVDVLLGKLIVFGHIFGILDDCIIIAAGLNGKSMFSIKVNKKLKSFAAKLKWAGSTFSDCTAILYAYRAWDRNKEKGSFKLKHTSDVEMKFCDSFSLEKKQLDETYELIKEIRHSLKYMDIEVPVSAPISKYNLDVDLLRDIVLFGAFYPNYFVKHHNQEREREAFRALDKNDPLTSVFFDKFPEDHVKFGELYKTQVRQILKDVNKDIARIKFTGSKIIIGFNKFDLDDKKKREGGNSKGEHSIPSSVLLVLKQGKLNRNKQSLKLYDTTDAQEFLDKQNSANRSAKLTVHQLPAPDMTNNTFQFSVVSIDSPHSFWGVPYDQTDNQNFISSIISDNIHSCPPVQSIKEVEYGGVFLAPFDDDEEYHRVKVESIPAKLLKVFYVDFGNSKWLDLSKLRSIPNNIQVDLSCPAVAVECSLVGVQPNQARNIQNYWDSETIKQFVNKLDEGNDSERPFTATIYSDVPNDKGINKYLLKLSNMEMYDKAGLKVNIDNWLLKKNLAEPKLEGYNSQMRAKERIEFCSQNEAMQDFLNDPHRYHQTEDLNINEKDTLRMAAMTGIIQGPYSPLETSVTSTNKRNSGCRTYVESESVNSILLDSSPADKHDVWMVADRVGVSANTGVLSIRNTSWLPPRPGIGATVAMMFAPRVQMRVNKEKTNFTGCLLGLGCKEEYEVSKKGKKVWRALHPSYDMDICFDARFGEDELFLLNGIRHSLSEILGRGPEGIWRLNQVRFLHETRETLKHYLTTVLAKEMSYKEKEMIYNTEDYKWRGGLKGDSSLLYRKIDRPFLVNPFDALDRMCIRDERVEAEYPVFCPVCSKVVESAASLLNHIKTPPHIQATKRLQM